MEIREEAGRFFIGEKENSDAEIVYKFKEKNVIVIDRTYVSEPLRGKNIAGLLLEKVIEKARGEGLKVIPECSYAEKVMNRGDDYADILYKK